MRTPKLRAVAVIAGFLGLSLVVAGTASAMVTGHVDAPIANAIQLQQEDPTSETAPVPATKSINAPIEVGSGAIKCDENGECASRIKVEANKPDPAPEVEPKRASTPRNNTPQRSDQATAKKAPKPADTPKVEPNTDKPAHQPKPKDSNKGGHGKDGGGKHRGDRTDHWNPGNWDFEWHEGWRGEWNPGDWSGDHWRDGWGKRNH